MEQKVRTKKVYIGIAISTALLILVLSLIPGHLRKREMTKHVNEIDQAVRSLQLGNLRDQYSPVATLLADNAYITNIRNKTGSSRIYYAGLLREQIREFFEIHSLLMNILVYLDDVKILIDKNYLLLDPEHDKLLNYIGYDPFFPDQPEFSLGRNCRIVLPNRTSDDYQFQNGNIAYLRFEFPRYIADPANAEVQFAIDYEQIARQSLGVNYDQLVALYLVQQESDGIHPLLLNSELFETRSMDDEEYLSDDWQSLLSAEMDSGGGNVFVFKEHKHRISTLPVGVGLSMVAIWDHAPPDSPLQFLNYLIFAGVALGMVLLLASLIRTMSKAKRDQGITTEPSPVTLIAIDNNEKQQPKLLPELKDEVSSVHSISETKVSDNDLRSYIDEHFTNPDLNAKFLAATFNYSEKHIYALWREVEDVSIADYIQDLRLNAAYEQVVRSNDAINDIAQQTGFTSYNTFYKAFRRKYDLTPSQIRRNNSTR